jgi:hypothetical protein
MTWEEESILYGKDILSMNDSLSGKIISLTEEHMVVMKKGTINIDKLMGHHKERPSDEEIIGTW